MTPKEVPQLLTRLVHAERRVLVAGFGDVNVEGGHGVGSGGVNAMRARPEAKGLIGVPVRLQYGKTR